MSSSGYAIWSVVASEMPTTAKWNILGSNDASFNAGLGFNDGILVARHFTSGSILSTVLALSSGFTGGVHSQTNAGSAGGGVDYINIGGIKYCWGQTNNCGALASNAASTLVVTLPTSFFTTVQTVVASPTNHTIDNRVIAYPISYSATTVNMCYTSLAAGANATCAATWIAIGT